MSDIDYKIKKAKEFLANLERTKQKLIDDEGKTQSPTGALAIALHSRMCRCNHTDDCPWFYEVENGLHNWNAREHAIYWDKAVRIITKDNLPAELVIRVLGVI